jgi:hypothetical protein
MFAPASSAFELLFSNLSDPRYLLSIVGGLTTSVVIVKCLVRAVTEIVRDVDDCRLACRESHARLRKP